MLLRNPKMWKPDEIWLKKGCFANDEVCDDDNNETSQDYPNVLKT
jgi:hypothetical protein